MSARRALVYVLLIALNVWACFITKSDIARALNGAATGWFLNELLTGPGKEGA